MYIYKTIIFDLDGILFKTDSVFGEAVQQMCNNRGIDPVDDKAVLRFIGEISETMDKLTKEGYTLCLCTNGIRQYVDNILKAFKISGYFKIIKSKVEDLKKSRL
jgi:phosphoglycolate phosphatase